MIARKKFLGLLLVMVVLCSISIRPTVAEREEEPDIESKIELVPVEEVSSSDDYVDNKFEVVLINDDVNQTMFDNVKCEYNLEYNVTFEIRSIDKGTFDNATIINATSIKFEASNVAYGTNRTGEAIIRLYGSSPIAQWLLVAIAVVVIIVIAAIVGPIIHKALKSLLKKRDQDIRSLTTVFDAEGAEIETETGVPEVPEFPSGDLIALCMGIGILIIFLFRRKNTKSPRSRKETSKTPKNL